MDFTSTVCILLLLGPVYLPQEITAQDILPATCTDSCDRDDCTLNCHSLNNLSFLHTLDSTKTQRTVLSFDNSRLTVIAADTFSNPAFAEVQALNLPYNKIQTIEPRAFHGMQLSTLALDYNEISQITNVTVSGLTELNQMSLDYNNISSIERGSFLGLVELEHLGLSFNLLTVITSRMFEGASELYLLNLSSNKITTIETEAFYGLSKLVYLHLDNNLIMKVGTETFIELRALGTLGLSSNKIAEIEANAFQGSKRIKHVDLSNNRFENKRSVYLNVSSSTRIKF